MSDPWSRVGVFGQTGPISLEQPDLRGTYTFVYPAWMLCFGHCENDLGTKVTSEVVVTWYFDRDSNTIFEGKMAQLWRLVKSHLAPHRNSTALSHLKVPLTFHTEYSSIITTQLHTGAACSAIAYTDLLNISVQSGKVKLDPPMDVWSSYWILHLSRQLEQLLCLFDRSKNVHKKLLWLHHAWTNDWMLKKMTEFFIF